MSPTSRLTVAEYDRMIDEGQFTPFEEHELELIDGEIVARVRARDEQSWVLQLLMEWSYASRPDVRVRIRSKGPVSIPVLDSVPEPDLVWLRHRSYRHAHPGPDDVLLLVESAVMGLWYKRGTKASLYARAGILDYWIINISDRCVEVRRDPRSGIYRSLTVARPGDSISLLAFPEVSLPVAILFEDPDEIDPCGS